jgi:hypothetical protein
MGWARAGSWLRSLSGSTDCQALRLFSLDGSASAQESPWPGSRVGPVPSGDGASHDGDVVARRCLQ